MSNSKKTTVLHIISSFDIGATAGGAELAALELCRHLNRDEVTPIVCIFWSSGTPIERDWQDILIRENIHWFAATPVGMHRNSNDYFKGVAEILRWCKQNPVDIIHAHHEGGALAAILAKSLGRNYAAIRTLYVPLHQEWGIGLVHFIFRHVFSRFLFPALLDAEIPVSPWYAKLLLQRWVTHWVKPNIHVIHNARRLDVQPVIPPEGKAWLIGNVGRLTAQKQQAVLIDAMPKVLSVFPKIILEIVGEGELHESLLKQAQRLNIAAHIQFLGQRADVIALMRHWRAFVLPSAWEGLPIVLLEAIAQGTPVVASDIPGNSDLIQHERTGWLVQEGDPNALADAILDALKHPKLALDYAQSAQSILPQFSIEACVAKYQTLYHQLLK